MNDSKNFAALAGRILRIDARVAALEATVLAVAGASGMDSAELRKKMEQLADEILEKELVRIEDIDPQVAAMLDQRPESGGEAPEPPNPKA